MNIKRIIAAVILAAMLITLAACKKETTDPTPINPNSEAMADIPAPYSIRIAQLLSEWELREGSMSDPLIGTRLLMYDNVKKCVVSKDEIGFMLIDLDGNGVEELITAPIKEFSENAMVYDIVTINEEGQIWHLANSLVATYHLMADNSFILRTPSEDGKSYSFKQVTINGSSQPTEVAITKEEAAKCYISAAELTPFSALEK